MRFSLSFTLPPPLSCFGSAEPASSFSELHLRLQTPRECASKPSSSKRVAASQLPAVRKSRGRTAAGETDAPRCWQPVPRRRDCASSSPDCDCHGSPLQPATLSCQPSTHPAIRGRAASSALSHRTHSPRSACRRSILPPARSEEHPIASCAENCNRTNVVADRVLYRHGATEANGWSQRGHVRCPSASIASCQPPKPASCSWWREFPHAVQRGNASPLPKAGPH